MLARDKLTGWGGEEFPMPPTPKSLFQATPNVEEFLWKFKAIGALADKVGTIE